MINNITNNPADLFKTTQKANKTESPPQANQVESQKDPGEQVTIGNDKDEAVVYNKPLGANQHIDIKFQILQQLVSSLSVSQGAAGALSKADKNQSINDLMVQLFNKFGQSTDIEIGDGKTIDLQHMTPDEAQKLIADDGYWGVEQTSQRIVDFAKAQIGTDLSKFEKVKDAIMRGFNSAKEAFGGFLPDISQKTIDTVVSKLDKLFEE